MTHHCMMSVLLFGLQLSELHIICFFSHAQVFSPLATTLPNLQRGRLVVTLVVVGRIERILAQFFVQKFQLIGGCGGIVWLC